MFALLISVCVTGPGCYRDDLQGLCGDTDTNCVCYTAIGFQQGSGTDCTCFEGLKIGIASSPIPNDINSCYYNTSLGFTYQYKITIGLTEFLPDVCDTQRGFLSYGTYDEAIPEVFCTCRKGSIFDDALGTCLFDVNFGFLPGKQFSDYPVVCDSTRGFLPNATCIEDGCSCECTQGLKMTTNDETNPAKCSFQSSFGFVSDSDYAGAVIGCNPDLGFEPTGQGSIAEGFHCNCAPSYTIKKSDFHVKTCECDYNLGYYGEMGDCKCYDSLEEDAANFKCNMIPNNGFISADPFDKPPYQNIVPSICDTTKGFKADAVISENKVYCICDDSLGFSQAPFDISSVLTCKCNIKHGFIEDPIGGKCECNDDLGFNKTAPLPMSNLTCSECRVGLELYAANFSCQCGQLFHPGFYSTALKCACLSGQIKDTLDGAPLTCEPQVECVQGQLGCLSICAGVACVCQKQLGFFATSTTTCECIDGLLVTGLQCMLDTSKGFIEPTIIETNVENKSKGKCDTKFGYFPDPSFRPGIKLMCYCDVQKGFISDGSGGCTCDTARGFESAISAEFTCICQPKLALQVISGNHVCKCDKNSGFRMIPFVEIDGEVTILTNASDPANCECEWIYGFVPDGDGCKCDAAREFVENDGRCTCLDSMKANILGICQCGFTGGYMTLANGSCTCSEMDGFRADGVNCKCAEGYVNVGGFCKCDMANNAIAMYIEGQKCPCKIGYGYRGGSCKKNLNWIAIGLGIGFGVIGIVGISVGVAYAVKKYKGAEKKVKEDKPDKPVKTAQKKVAFGKLKMQVPHMD